MAIITNMNNDPLILLKMSLNKIKKVLNLYIKMSASKKNMQGLEEEDFLAILDDINKIEERIKPK
jgi:hypothetical protein